MGEVVQLRKPAVAVLGPIVRVAAVLFVLCELAGLAYSFFFGLFALPHLTEMLVSVHVTDVFAIENSMLQMTLAPLAYAILAAISPLVGWWVYSRVETGGQASVMWGGATLFAVLYVGVGLALGGMLMTVNAFQLVLGLLILVVYVVFFMGLGFVPAQVLKLKL